MFFGMICLVGRGKGVYRGVEAGPSKYQKQPPRQKGYIIIYIIKENQYTIMLFNTLIDINNNIII